MGNIQPFTDMFERPEVAEIWAKVMNSQVRPYLEQYDKGRKDGGMMVWWVAIKQSQYCGLLKKELPYKQYASLLNEACPDYFNNIDSLVNSFKTINRGDHTDMRDDMLDLHGPKIRKMLIASIREPRPVLSGEATIIDIVTDIAEKLVDESYNRTTSFVRRDSGFVKGSNTVRPPVAVVTYPSSEAIRQDRPSSVVSFEFVDGELKENHVHIYNSMYLQFAHRHHLVLVARSVADDNVVQMCDNRDFGLCLVNPDGSWRRILSRTVNDFSAIAAARHALFGGRFEKRIITYHKRFTTLPDMLKQFGVCVKPEYQLDRPILSRDDIKRLTAKRLDEIGCDMNGYCVTNKNLADLASLLGVNYNFGFLPDYQLEQCDFDANEITINLSLVTNENRGRFTLSHGLGHFDMQKPYLDEFVYSFSDNTYTLSGQSRPRTFGEWLEWQANFYGRYTTMPDEIMRNLIARCFEKRTLRMGKLYVNDDRWNLEAYDTTLRKMRDLSHVSKQALANRLIEMNMLVDERTNKPNYAFIEQEPK